MSYYCLRDSRLGNYALPSFHFVSETQARSISIQGATLHGGAIIFHLHVWAELRHTVLNSLVRPD